MDDSLVKLRLLIEHLRLHFQELGLYPRTNVYGDVVLLALVSKSIVLAEAIACLAENGFEAESFGLCRTLIEIALTTRYITNKDTESRAKRYGQYWAKDKHEWTRLMAKYYHSVDRPEGADYTAGLAKLYKSPHKWSDERDTLKSFAEEPDSFETDSSGKPLNDMHMYEVVFRWMSHYVHSTEPAIESHMTEAGDRFSVHRLKTRDRGRGEDAVLTSFLCIHLNIIRVFRTLKMSLPAELVAEMTDFEEKIRSSSKYDP